MCTYYSGFEGIYKLSIIRNGFVCVSMWEKKCERKTFIFDSLLSFYSLTHVNYKTINIIQILQVLHILEGVKNNFILSGGINPIWTYWESKRGPRQTVHRGYTLSLMRSTRNDCSIIVVYSIFKIYSYCMFDFYIIDWQIVYQPAMCVV